MAAQANYRFQVHRRTMILQAINASASAVPSDPDVICCLASQLSDITQACDRLMEELLRIADQQAQLAKVQDLHWASALAIALRKINKSYERRTNELREAYERIDVLNAELEEAWKEAEMIAQEMDGLEITLIDRGEENDDEEEELTTHTAHVVGVTGTALAALAKLVPSDVSGRATPTFTQDHDQAEPSIFSSSRSRRQSGRSDRSKWDQIAAAKARSRRTSDANLRVTKRSRSKTDRDSQPPPVPTMTFPGVQVLQQDSFLDLNTPAGKHYLVPPFSVGTYLPKQFVLFFFFLQNPSASLVHFVSTGTLNAPSLEPILLKRKTPYR